MTTTPARDAIWRHLTGASLCSPPRSADEATALLNAHAAEVRAAGLTEPERRFLTFALDLAADRMLSEDGFTGDDEAALESLRRMAAATRPDGNTPPRCPDGPCAVSADDCRDGCVRAEGAGA